MAWRTGAAVVVAGVLVLVGGLPERVTSVAAQRGVRVGQPAPELAGGPWINSPPLSLDRLRGRVLFVEFWTYG